MDTTESLNELSAARLIDGYRRKALSPVEVTQAVLARIADWEPLIRATYALDADGALAMARASEARWMRGEPAGPLDGVPVTLKENIATRGVPVPLGCAATELVPAAEDSPPAARLRKAGAVFVSKTTMPDFGLLGAAVSSFHPLTRNPWDLRRNTGGSSSGAGAAAAAGYGPLHLGTDIGGSVRIPAAFCGVFGFKPSFGRVPVDMPYPGRVTGPLTRTVRDAALAMQTIALPDARDHMSLPYQPIDWLNLKRDVKGLRIGLWLEPGNGVRVAPDVRASIERAAAAFEAAGATVVPVQPWISPGTLLAVARFWAARLRGTLAALPEARRAKVAEFVRRRALADAGATGDEVYDAYAKMLALRERTLAATRDFDYVLSPTFPQPPFDAEATHLDMDGLHPIEQVVFTIVFNMSEQPAASINCGYTDDGLPIGLQIVGRRFDDHGVLQLAQRWEDMGPARRAWPEPAAARLTV
ncbi:amidase [Burkholderia pseudomultivorans]|uniref:Amidase n=1 Tax=Burkholderia pseudomultivorans TaxID=1207504 RepID=A0A132F3X0_9BURK|nr:amidase [Burkholderia pseudomultivorans]KWF68157.1 amidase [Burkholderia pseudomultivorans]